MTKPALSIRPMGETDLPQVLAIEQAVFPGDPWPRSAFSGQFDNPLVQSIVMVLDGTAQDTATGSARPKVIGYASTWLIVDEAHLMNIAVKRSFQGQGLGEFLLLNALGRTRTLGAEICTLEVRPSNVRAKSLYRNLGFHVAGRRRHYYVDNGEDALIMTSDKLATLQPLHDQRLQTVSLRLSRTYDLRMLKPDR